MDMLLILVAVFSFAANSIVTRFIQIKLPVHEQRIRLYQSIYCFIGSVAFFVVGGCQFLFDPATLICGIMFGILFFATTWLCSICYEKGSMSITSITVNMSLIIPLFYSWVVLKEQITVFQIVGTVLIIITLILSALPDKNKRNTVISSSLLWLIPLFIAFAANGSTAVIQKYYVASNPCGNRMTFMALAYVTSSVSYLVLYRIRRADKKTEHELINKNILLLLCSSAVIAGLGSCGGNALLSYLCDKVDGGILYPCINGGLTTVSAIASFAVFKEKISTRKIAAIVIGVISLIILNT